MLSPNSAPRAGGYPSAGQQAEALCTFLRVKVPRVSTSLAEAVIQALAPSPSESVKGLAKRLRPLIATFGVPIKHAAALEAAARIQGQDNWHTTPVDLRTSTRSLADGASVNDSGPTTFPKALGLFAVADPEVAELLDLSSGRCERHADVIGDDYEKALQLRMQLQTDLKLEKPRFLCSMCMTPVYLVSRPEGRKFFFRHSLEDGRCSAVTRGFLSQEEINARKYNGVKESWLHLEMKAWIASCLNADPRFSDIVIEGRWSGEFSGEWRKPDVRATFNGMRIAFEIHLSTTYINVIAQRREFYRQEGGLLFWIFANFNMGARRLTQEDVFYNNNRNAFVVNRRTRDASLEQGRFMLDCIWAAPTTGGGVSELQREMVPFDTLTFDQEKQRAFHFDFDGERERLAREAEARRQAQLQALRDRFEAWYTAYATTRIADDKTWGELRRDFASVGAPLPEYAAMLPKGLLNALYSTKHGRVIGWDYSNFIQIAHHVEPGLREYLHYFRGALKAYGRADLIRREDQSGKWAGKVAEYKARIKAGDSAYTPDKTHDGLVRMLFPEVMAEQPA